MLRPMKSNPKTADPYTTFQNALRQVLQVSKADLNRMLTEEKIANAGKPKPGLSRATLRAASLPTTPNPLVLLAKRILETRRFSHLASQFLVGKPLARDLCERCDKAV